jgi:MYXO-CTERM domain-containing protein
MSGMRATAWFLVWAVIGAGLVLGILTGFTIGVFVLPATGVLIVVVATRKTSAEGVLGLVSGLGVPLCYVAYLNRDGPGEICRQYANGSSCTQEWNPWPWLVVGAAFVLGGVALFALRRRRPVVAWSPPAWPPPPPSPPGSR